MDNPLLPLMREARRLYKEKSYAEALSRYERLWQSDKSLFYSDDLYSFCVCLRKGRRSSDALPIAETLIETEPNNSRFNNIYGWILYDCLFHEKQPFFGEEFLDQARKILSKTKQEPHSPYELTVLKTLEWLKKHPDLSERHTDSWIQKVDPGGLDVTSFDFHVGKGKTIRRPSNAESWYLEKTEWLLSKNRFSECLLCCDDALTLIDQKIPDGEPAPFLWRRGVSRFRLGNPSDALSDLLDAQRKVKIWAIPFEIAKVSLALEDRERAFKCALKAALFPLGIELKTECYGLLANLYRTKSQFEMERKCLLLYQLVMESLNREGESEFSERVKAIERPHGLSYSKLYKELESLWRLSLKKVLTPVEGQLLKMLPQKKGFLKGKDGRDYFYGLAAFQGVTRQIHPGTPVEAYYDPDETSERSGAIEAYWVAPLRTDRVVT